MKKTLLWAVRAILVCSGIWAFLAAMNESEITTQEYFAAFCPWGIPALIFVGAMAVLLVSYEVLKWASEKTKENREKLAVWRFRLSNEKRKKVPDEWQLKDCADAIREYARKKSFYEGVEKVAGITMLAFGWAYIIAPVELD